MIDITLRSVADGDLRALVPLVAIGFMALEFGLSRLARHDSYDLKETAASFAIAMGNKFIRPLEAGLLAAPFALAYQYRLFEIDIRQPLALAALFLGTEFFYYWHHRAAHRIRWLWATHAVHHSPTRLNFTAAIRLGWTGSISGNFVFFLPMVWIGFHPLAVLGALALNLAYQFFLHTELPIRLGSLEWVLNSPAHHRVHHASNESCLDRNYGGVLIVYDRIFGTFARAPEGETLRYGLVMPVGSHNPIRIAFAEWLRMARDFRAARGWRGRWRALFGAP